jgi:hypothetical protein
MGVGPGRERGGGRYASIAGTAAEVQRLTGGKPTF